MADGDNLVFAEVKLRKSRQFADAADFVDTKKRNRIRRTAEYWLMTHSTALQPRFDVVEIYDGGRLATDEYDKSDFEINHMIGAF